MITEELKGSSLAELDKIIEEFNKYRQTVYDDLLETNFIGNSNKGDNNDISKFNKRESNKNTK